jgi:hypothetical protein
MPRRLLLVVALAGAVLPGSASAASLVSARLSECSAEERRGVFEGAMEKTKESMRLQIRFTLQARTPATGRWGKISAPGFGAWNTSAPGVRRYVYRKEIDKLVGPSSYRVRVDFRWRSASGRTLRRTSRHTKACAIGE